MSIQQIQKSQASELAVRLFDGADTPVTGVAVGDITVLYLKQAGAWTNKPMLATEWEEGPEGRYSLTFTAAELDTEGRFTFRVNTASADTFTGDVNVVDTDATINAKLVQLLNALSTKVSSSSVKEAKMLQDLAINALNKRCDASEAELKRIQSVVSVLQREI